MTEPWTDLTSHRTGGGINGSSVDADDDRRLDVHIPPGEGGTPVERICVWGTHLRPRFLTH
jgi:hypothetical protein